MCNRSLLLELYNPQFLIDLEPQFTHLIPFSVAHCGFCCMYSSNFGNLEYDSEFLFCIKKIKTPPIIINIIKIFRF